MGLGFYLKLLRPNVCVMAVLGLVIGCVVGCVDADIMSFSCAVVATFLICGSGNVINDYFDYEIDKVNKPYRVLASNKVSRKSAFLFFLVLGFFGLLLAYFVSFYFFNSVSRRVVTK